MLRGPSRVGSASQLPCATLHPRACCITKAHISRASVFAAHRHSTEGSKRLGAAPVDGHGCGNGGDDGHRGIPIKFERDGPEPGKHSWWGKWLSAVAMAAGGYVVLGLLEPWAFLHHPTPINTSQLTVAVVMPVLNESTAVVTTLQHLHQLTPPLREIIVVDGGSNDDTVKLVKRSGLASKVLKGTRGRASQMNIGADAASADLLCFLHADTLPPSDLVVSLQPQVSIMRRELSDPRVVLAGFSPSIEVPGRKLHFMSFHNWVKTYYAPMLFRPLAFLRGMRALFGDQAMFCRAADFRSVGGFDTKLSIMEDADLCIRMHEAGPATLPGATGSRASRGRNTKETTMPNHCQHSSRKQQRGIAALNPLAEQQQQQEQRHGSMPQGSILTRMQQWSQQVLPPRGRIKQVLDRQCVTSGRRIAAWGTLRATYIHVVIGTSWYFGMEPQQLRKLYHKMYTDSFR